MKRCLIYTRVSTIEQARGDFTSVDSQERVCHHAIALKEEEGWHHVKTITDPGYSGKDLDRPGMKQVLAEIEAGMYDVIVVYKVDRVSRSLVKFYDFYNLLQEKGIAFFSATQNFDTSTSAGKLMLNMLLSFAEYEREIIMERTRDRMRSNFERGKWNGGWVPFGYDYRAEERVLVPNPDEKEAIELIFKMVDNNSSPSRVADELNDRGFRTKKRKIKKKDGEVKDVGQNFFTCDSVTNIVRNPIYVGKVRHGDEIGDGQHEAIVSEKLFEKANSKIGRNGHDGPPTIYNRDGHVHVLKGLVYCADCGSLMTPFPSGKKDKDGSPYLYYTCTDVVHHKRRSTCRLRRLPARPFEKTIREFLKCLGQNETILAACIAEANKGKGKGVRRLQTKKRQLEMQIADLTAGIKNFAEFLKSGEPVPDDMLAEYRAQVRERDEVKTQLEMTEVELGVREREKIDTEIIQDSLRLFDKVVEALPLEDQKELMQLLIKEIRVTPVNTEKQNAPSEEGAFISKLRTKLVKVNVSLFEIPSLPVTYDSSEQKFVIQSKWLPEQDSNL